ncbi:MAG TPA: Calx-beta domain-containing protein [Thermoanaerobaculia bacterium]
MRPTFAAFALVLFLSTPVFAYTVNDLGDAPDATPGDNVCATAGAVCTLRAAIEEANAHAGTDTIDFSVAGTITPGTPYPPITGVTTINGATAPGYAGVPLVVIDGAFSVTIGLQFVAGSSGSSVSALKLHGFSTTAIDADVSVQIVRSYLGPVGGGTPNFDGLQISGTGSTIGGADGFGNVISGNQHYGIRVEGSGHVIRDNFIGTDASGAAAQANGDDGIYVGTGATNVTIGSSVAAERNVISGNNTNGIELDGANAITIVGNYIGVDAAGTNALPNQESGVYVLSGSSNIIGNATGRNVISANLATGVTIEAGTGNVIAGNYIGTNATGTAALGNGTGVLLNAAGNSVGSTSAGNVISGNQSAGVEIGADNSTVINNYIGPDASGAVGIGNAGYGVIAVGKTAIVIGGTVNDTRNVISFNGQEGILFASVTNSQIYGNYIGTNAAGTAILGNGSLGVLLIDTTNVRLGTDQAPGRNVISGNSAGGVVVAASPMGSSVGNYVDSNDIGLGADHATPLGNLGTGVEVSGAQNTNVRLNLISGNDGHGIEVTGGASGTIVFSNGIGVRHPNFAPLGNSGDGINICEGATNTALSANTIANNGGNGIGVEPTALLGNTWSGAGIFRNAGLQIDLNKDGVTPNDLNDPDEGPNALQNFPVIVSAVTAPSGTQVRGTINTTANTPVTVNVVFGPRPEPLLPGEETGYLGSTNVMTDGSGNASWVVTGSAITAGFVATATATSPSGSSEFSAYAPVNPAPTVQFSTPMYSVTEGDGSVLITVSRTGDLNAISTVRYDTSMGTAVPPGDYTTTGGVLTFNPGETAKSFSVPIIDDPHDEAFELINLTLSLPNAATLGAQSTSQITIGDNDPGPVISIGDRTLAEGNSGTTNFQFTISIAAESSLPVEIDYATAPGTATPGTDYTHTTGHAVIAPGNFSTTIVVPVAGDATFEPDETFFVNLSNPVNATPGDMQGLGTISNDEGVPTLTINDVALGEGNAGSTPFTFTLTLSAASATPVTVDWATANNTAMAPGDYTAVPTTQATIPANALSTTVVVQVIGDAVTEPNETFFVNLSNANGAAIGDAQGLGTILNDEGALTVAISDVTQSEATSPFAFTLTLSGMSATPVTVDYATANGTALAPGDYTTTSGTAIIAPNTLTTTINVPVINDATAEANETFFVNLTGAAGATITDNQGLGTIVNDDAAPAVADLAISKTASATNFAAGIPFTFTITVRNLGPGTATGVIVTDPLPPVVTLNTATTPSGTCSGTTTVTCTIPTLANGANAVITINVTPNAAAPAINVATVTANEADPNPANNSASVTLAIPTMQTWMLLLLAAALAVMGSFVMKT